MVSLTYQIIRIYATNELGTMGPELHRLQQETKKLESENMILRAQILEATSLTTIERKALEMGFVKQEYKDIIWLQP